MTLILRLLAGIVIGVIIGLLAPGVGAIEGLARVLVTFQSLFGQFINFTIPLIILFYIMSGVANLQQGSGRSLGTTIGFAYLSTIIAGSMAFFITSATIPNLMELSTMTSAETASLKALVALEIPPIMGVMTALMMAFAFGMGISTTNATELKIVIEQARDIVELMLSKVLIPGLPFYIAGVFANMAYEGTVFSTLQTFGIVLMLAVAMHWLWLAVLFFISGSATGRNPITMIKTMLPAYFTAIGTMSSAATIPVTVHQAKALNIDDNVVDFCVPLCATIHLSGSAITLTTCATAIMLLTDMTAPGFLTFLPFLMMLGVTLIAAPGAPGGAVMASLGLLSTMLGFGEAAIALMIALYMAQDSFGTACNVTGDGAITALVEKFGKAPAVESNSAQKHAA